MSYTKIQVGVSKFLDVLQEKGLQISIEFPQRGNSHQSYIVTAIEGSNAYRFFCKRAREIKGFKRILRGYDLVAGVIRTPPIIYTNFPTLEIAFDYVEGITLWDIIEMDHPNLDDYVAKCAKSLRELHEKTTMKKHPSNNVDEELLKRSAKPLFEKGVLNEVTLQIQYGLIEWEANSMVSVIHGDAHVGNFIIDKDENVWLIDPDRARISNPYIDLNTFVTHVRCVGEARGYGKEKIERLERIILEAYEGRL